MQRLFLGVFLMLLITSAVYATAQDSDILVHNGKTYALFSNPLEDFYGADESKRPKFWVEPNTTSTANWRGYVATWSIVGDKLYLSNIDSWFCLPTIKTETGCRQVTIGDLFGNDVVDGKVYASWVSDKLRVPDGKELKYVHSGYASIYERDLIFDVVVGKVVKQEIIDNTKHELPSEREIYQKELARLKKNASQQKKTDTVQPSAQKASGTGEPMLITEKGWGTVSVGSIRKDVELILGKGDHDGRRYDDVYFVEYPQKGIQISYTNETDEVYVIFFYNKPTYAVDYIPASVRTDKGVTWKSLPKDVIKAYGKAPRDYSDDTGNNAWRRLEYDKMDFLFESGRLTRISVSNEKCTGCKK